MTINSVQPVQPLDIAAPSSGAGPATNADFLSMLRSAYSSAERSGAEASRMVDQFLSGEANDLHTVALAGQRATLQFEMLLQVRNKLVQAYQEVMRMQL
jgi:flagellar hook-basal body complex protein FliE